MEAHDELERAMQLASRDDPESLSQLCRLLLRAGYGPPTICESYRLQKPDDKPGRAGKEYRRRNMALGIVKDELLRHLGNEAYRVVVVRQLCFEMGRESFGLSAEERETIDAANRTRRGRLYMRRLIRLKEGE